MGGIIGLILCYSMAHLCGYVFDAPEKVFELFVGNAFVWTWMAYKE